MYCTDCHAPVLLEAFLVVVYVMLCSHWLAPFWGQSCRFYGPIFLKVAFLLCILGFRYAFPLLPIPSSCCGRSWTMTLMRGDCECTCAHVRPPTSGSVGRSCECDEVDVRSPYARQFGARIFRTLSACTYGVCSDETRD
jgi:hypothetical protein